MNVHEKDSIQKYNSIAQSYDTSFDGKFTAKFKTKLLELCSVSHGDVVLDVGCGNGSLINGISEKANIQAYGVDISPNMIEECQKTYPNINFAVSNGEGLEFEDSSIDLLTICCVLHHLNNPQNFFAEAYRVLKPGGILIVAEPWFPFGLRQFVDYVVSPIMKAGDNKMFTHSRLKRLFTDNGFSRTEFHKKGYRQILQGRKS